MSLFIESNALIKDLLSYRSSHHDLFVYDDDNEVTELGDTDVACDFGGDFGGF